MFVSVYDFKPEDNLLLAVYSEAKQAWHQTW